jgi:hypothetical protein
MEDIGHITPKQTQTIRALLKCKTQAEAARKAGVGQNTIWRWFQEPAFIEAYRAASARSLDAAVGALQAACGEAVELLRDVMADKTAHVGAKVSAARSVLEIAIRAKELIEHEERIAELEQRLASTNRAPGLRRVK